MPDLSPRASRSAWPRVIAVSSTVWCASISMSPSAVTARSSRPCLASWASMWSKNGTPVFTWAAPVPSRPSSTTTLVSLVARSSRADLISLPPSRCVVPEAGLLAGAVQDGQQRATERVHLSRRPGAHPQPAGRADLPDQHPPLQQGLPDRAGVAELTEQDEVRVGVRHCEPLAAQPAHQAVTFAAEGLHRGQRLG